MRLKWFGLQVMLILLAACSPIRFRGTEYPEGVPASDFTLVDTEGRSYQLSERQGEIALLFWGYTSCPDVCPVTLTEAKRTIQRLGDDAERVEFLFITVDPERDTPEVLGKYVGAFHPDITGLTGTPDELASIREAYGIYAAKVPLESSLTDYAMEHTARVFLVDRDGRLRLSYAYGIPADDIVQDVRYLFRQ